MANTNRDADELDRQRLLAAGWRTCGGPLGEHWRPPGERVVLTMREALLNLDGPGDRKVGQRFSHP